MVQAPPVGGTPSSVEATDWATEASEEELIFGDGFLVWESNRSGEWRIWARSLDGGTPRQLSPEEADRQHYAPHISPDGSTVVYLSSRDNGRRYGTGGTAGSLHLIAPDGSNNRLLIERVRTYFENRSVVWRSPTELIYIGDERATHLLDIERGHSRPLTAGPADGYGWLIDATLRHASRNDATFSIYDSDRLRIVPRTVLGGCQPYFSHDGRWGVWTAGAGGPISRIDLDTRQIGKLLDKNDSRMPDGWGYLYFPMLSRDGSLLTFAASRSEHDHFTSDYDVFVVETDPVNLELIRRPVRYTEHPSTDRYPDVYRAPLELGRYRGEAPYEIELSASGNGWTWAFGDGGQGEGHSVQHYYSSPGRYAVEASRGGETLRGQVVVAPAEAPRIVGTRLSGDGRRVSIDFDEPINVEKTELAFVSGRAISSWSTDNGGRRLQIDLGAPFETVDRLVVSGVEDRAQRPNRMAEAVLEIGPPMWPIGRDGLVFVWQTGETSNLVMDDENGIDRAINLRASGLARLDHAWTMLPGTGRFEAEAADAARVTSALRGTNEMTLRLTVDPAMAEGRASLVSLASRRQQNFRLELRGGTLVFHLRTGSRGPEANRSIDLVELPVGRPSHVVLTYSPGDLGLWVDGERRLELGAETIRGDFFHWRDLPLTFGGGRKNLRLEGVAIYERVLDGGAIEADFERYRRWVEGRPSVRNVEIEAKLVERSPAPRLEEIFPYREALMVYEYEVLKTLSGQMPDDRIRVAHWSILGGSKLALKDLADGSIHTLRLQPFAANPQLASLFRAQAEAIGADLPLYYAPDLVD